MKQVLLSTVAGLAFALPATHSHAADVTITADLRSFGGPRAYAVIYITDPNGTVYDTLLVAGTKSKYYGHLRDWARGVNNSPTPIHSVTGASAGSGSTLRVAATIADNLIAAGYQIRVDASIEDVGDYPRAAVLTLGQDTSVTGRGIVRTLSAN